MHSLYAIFYAGISPRNGPRRKDSRIENDSYMNVNVCKL